jgi:hypothetical protein
MKYSILQNNNLELQLEKEDYDYLNELIENQDVSVLRTYECENDFITERLTTNSEFSICSDDDKRNIGALTDSMILCIKDNENNILKVWWFPEYECNSFLEILYNKGSVIFTYGC